MAPGNQPESEAAARGAKIIQEMWGEEYGHQLMETWGAIFPDLQRYIVEFVAGDIWARPGLDLKTRSLITMAVGTAQGRDSQTRLHIRGALGNGATPREIIEALFQLAPYAGFPSVWAGLSIAQEVFKEQGVWPLDET